MTEDQLEQEALGWLADVGYTVLKGADIAPDGLSPERDNYRQAVLIGRLHAAIDRLNPGVPATAREDALKQVLDLGIPVLLSANRHFHRLLVAGVPVQYQKDGETRGDFVRLLDWARPEANDWLAVNQFSIRGPQHTRRPDIILFVNGLPLVLLELKNPADQNADVWKAYEQIQTYKEQIPDVFQTNEMLVISDGNEALLGSLSADPERFMAWRTIDGATLDPLGAFNELQTLVRGVLAPVYLLDYQNRSIETAQVMEELIQMARKFREASLQGEKLGLTEDEVRFYYALIENESAVRELSDETLKKIAHELTENLRQNLSVDWSARESVQAKLRLMVKRILRKYKYPPDHQDAAVDLVLEQVQALGESWAV